VHHWLIDSPNGPKSKAKCKKCHAESEFENSMQYSSWYGFNKTKRPKSQHNAYKNGLKPVNDLKRKK
jgi:hypothetical protein